MKKVTRSAAPDGGAAPRRPILSTVGEWLAALKTSELPEDTLRAARYQLANMVAAAHAAGSSPDCHGVLGAMRALACGGGKSTVIATGEKLSAVEAAMSNAAFAMAHDFDDIIFAGHTCHSAVFAPLAVAEHESCSTEELLTAVVAANEIGGRLGASCYLGPLNGQMTSYVHLASAAAATAKLLRLDAERCTHALAIALSQPNFLLQPGFFAPTSKLLTASIPTATGIRAAYLAAGGVTGAANILEDPRGLWKWFAFVPLPHMMGGLGEFWALQTLSIKNYPGCFYFQTACSALSELRRRHRLSLESVRRVRIETTKFGVEVTGFAAEYAGTGITPVNVDFDLSIAAAIMLHAGRFSAHEHDATWLKDNSPALEAWREKIEVRHDPALTVKVLQGGAGIEAGRAALRSLKSTEVAGLISKYRAHYRSQLLTMSELSGWIRAALGVATGKSEKRAPSGSAVPLYFPARVTVQLHDGTQDTLQIDLPEGSFSAPGVEETLRTKFLQEVSPGLGAAGATQAFEGIVRRSPERAAELAALCTRRAAPELEAR